MNPWEYREIENNSVYKIQAGNLRAYFRSRDMEWHTACRHSGRKYRLNIASGADWPGKSDVLTHESWLFDREYTSFKLKPALPDRPVIIRPESSVRIPPSQSIDVFFFIPLWLQLLAKDSRGDIVLMDVSCTILSNTWFGSPDTGTLGYALKADMTREYNSEKEGLFAVCPVSIQNQSASDLSFDRLVLHVEQLAVFEGENNLWTNRVHVLYRGEEQVSQLSIKKTPPAYEKTGEILCRPRQKISKNLLTMSFSLFKNLTGI